MKIPLCKPYTGEEELAKVRSVIESGWLAHGPVNQELEKQFADYIGVKHAVSFNSCTSALHLALEAQDIKGEVILPSFTFVASANAVVRAGATPVFVDIDYDTCNINPEKIREKITDRTEAIMPVHYAGQPCNMKEIVEIADDKGLEIIEDSAETLGGTFENKKTGSFGTGCFSFYPTKNITSGEGGMMTTNDDDAAKKAKTLKAHGIDSSTFEREKKEKPWLRSATYAGYNFRMCDVLAAIGLVQLEKVEEMNDLRRKHAAYLNKNLNIDGVDLPIESKDCKHVYQMYTIKIKDADRTEFIKKLREQGIGASVHFDPPVHLQPYYKDAAKGDLSVTEKVASKIVTLPMYPGLTNEELDHIINSVRDALKN